jgi:hypothetical protein
MTRDNLIAFIIGCLLFMVPFTGFMFTVEKLNNIQSTVNIHNDITTGNATYLPGKVCMIKSGEEDTPESIIRYARACASAHDSYLLEISPKVTEDLIKKED